MHLPSATRAVITTAIALAAVSFASASTSSANAASAHMPERGTFSYEYTDTTICGFPINIEGTLTDGSSQLGNLSGGRHMSHGSETWTGPRGSLLVTFTGSLQRRDEDLSGITVDAAGHWNGVLTATDYHQGITLYKQSQGSQVILGDSARITVAHTSYWVDDERVGRSDVLISTQGTTLEVALLCPYLT